MFTRPLAFQTPLPILQKIEQCRLKQTKHLNLSGGTAFGKIMLPIIPPEIFTLTHLEELDLSHHGIQVLPEDIKKLKHLKKLDLRYNPLRQVTDIFGLCLHYIDVKRLKLSPENIIGLKLTLFSYDVPKDIFAFPHLTTLDLSRHHLKQLPTWISKLSLSTLDLSFNQLSNLKGFEQLLHLTSLDLSFNQISDLGHLQQLTGLTTLNLSFNQLTDLKTFRPPPHLTTLNLKYNKLTSLESLEQLVHLNSLDVSHNQFTNLESLPQFVHLSMLNLSSNQIQSLEGLKPLVYLTALNVSNNQLNHLSGLEQLIRLVYLNLSFNQLNCLNGLEPLLHLTFLNLSNNPLSGLKELEKLAHLTSLDISHNQLSNLENITPIMRLTSLDVSHNQLKHLGELGRFVHLTALNVSHNQLKHLKGLEYLVHLTYLNVSHNQLRHLNGLKQLVHLTTLNASHNNINYLENLEYFLRLTYLNLSYNRLKSLEGLEQLVHLSYLNVSHNRLTCLEELGGSIHLNSLNVSHNQLTHLEGLEQSVYLTALNVSHNPLNNLKNIESSFLTSFYCSDNQLSHFNRFKQFVHLTSLYLSHNQFTNLEGIDAFVHLNCLNLAFNTLKILPNKLFSLPKLERLILEGNPILWPRMETDKYETTYLLEVRNYLRQLGEKAYHYEANLVGGGIEKTLLTQTTQEPSYLPKNDLHGSENTDPYKSENILNFSGQDIEYVTFPFMLTQGVLSLLVTDEGTPDFYYWLNMVEVLSDDNPFLVAKNRKTEHRAEFHEWALQFSQFKDVYAIYFNNQSKNFEPLFETICSYFKHVQHFNESFFPKPWLQIKQALETDERHEMSLEEFFSLCEQHGLKTQTEQRQLSTMLHNVGSVLHFQSDPILNQIIFLKPRWVAQVIYQVLAHPLVKNKLGQLTQDDLAVIWHEPHLIPDKYLRLMFNLKLCYPSKSHPNTYIAPYFLSIVPPLYTWEQPAYHTVFYKNYEFMPKGLLTQLTVVLHEHIAHAQQQVWKSGVVLDKDLTQAEIIENYDKHELKIKVGGRNKRTMMTLIIKTLQQIHSHYKRLKYEIWLSCHCGGDNSEFFKYDELKHCAHHHQPIQCRKCFKHLNPLCFLNDVLDFDQVEQKRKASHFDHEVTNSSRSFWINSFWYGIISVMVTLALLLVDVPLYFVIIAVILLTLLMRTWQGHQDLQEKSWMVKCLINQFPWLREVLAHWKKYSKNTIK